MLTTITKYIHNTFDQKCILGYQILRLHDDPWLNKCSIAQL